LAGTATHLRETSAINTSLSALQNCMEALRQRALGKNVLVPYNSDTLTKLFRVYFEGHGQAVRCAMRHTCSFDGHPLMAVGVLGHDHQREPVWAL
jgi:hypothetical protein